jgi:hypothetical protein
MLWQLLASLLIVLLSSKDEIFLVLCCGWLMFVCHRTLIPELKAGPSSMQQCIGRFLAALDYTAFPHGLLDAIQCLLEYVKNPVKSPLKSLLYYLMDIQGKPGSYRSTP